MKHCYEFCTKVEEIKAIIEEKEQMEIENALRLDVLKVEIDVKDLIIKEQNKSIEDMQQIEKKLRIQLE